jgi:transposase-like protein
LESLAWRKNDLEQQRREMVHAVRRGESARSVARRFDVSLATVQRWVERAGRQRLDRVDWAGRPRGGRRDANSTAPVLEDQIVQLRRSLKEQSDLGEHGAAAIRDELLRRGTPDVPSVRTIGRILARRGVLDGTRRQRHPPPPRGWYLPPLARRRAEMDCWDIVEGLALEGGTRVEVLNVISLHGGLVGSWPGRGVTATGAVEAILTHGRAFGLPRYVQFDNDTIFQGAHQAADTFGRVTRLCLQLGVTPVFVPPRETGFQAAIESYNGRWQARVWSRFHHQSLAALAERSERFVQAYRHRNAARRDAAPARRAVPDGFRLDLTKPLAGVVIYLRRSDERGLVSLLGHQWEVSRQWCHRLVRSEVDLTRGEIRFYSLRRRDPAQQQLLSRIDYRVPARRFQE